MEHQMLETVRIELMEQ